MSLALIKIQNRHFYDPLVKNQLFTWEIALINAGPCICSTFMVKNCSSPECACAFVDIIYTDRL